MSFDDDVLLEPEEVKRRAEEKKKSEHERARWLDDIRWVISKPQGRRFIWWVLSQCGFFRASYVAKDSLQTAFNEGRRDIGLAILIDLNEANPTVYAQMQAEYFGEKRKEKNKEKVKNE